MDQAHDITFWLAVLMIVCPVMDGMAAPATQIEINGGFWKGNLLAMLTIAAVVVSIGYVCRKVRHHE
jgi:hypothetical protein